MFNLCSGKTVGCGRWRRASVKLPGIIIGTGRSMLRPRPLTWQRTSLCAPAHASVHGRVYTHSFYMPVPLLCVQFKVSFPPSPQPPFLHTSPNSWQSNFPLLHLSGLVRLSAASLKGCTTTLLSIKIHGRGFAPSHEYSASATPSVRQ